MLTGETKLWSWRRDLNPRPSDYKSDALPAELRQPEQPVFPALKTRPRHRSRSRFTIAKVTTGRKGSAICRWSRLRLLTRRSPALDAIIPRLMRVVNRTPHAQAHQGDHHHCFARFSCWWRWLLTCGARPRPRPRGCFRNLTAFSISTCGRCAPIPTSTSTR